MRRRRTTAATGLAAPKHQAEALAYALPDRDTGMGTGSRKASKRERRAGGTAILAILAEADPDQAGKSEVDKAVYGPPTGERLPNLLEWRPLASSAAVQQH